MMPDTEFKPRLFVVVVRVSSPVTTIHTTLFIVALDVETARVIGQEVANSKFLSKVEAAHPQQTAHVDVLTARVIDDGVAFSNSTTRWRIGDVPFIPIED